MKKGIYSKLIIAFIILSNVGFTVSVLYVYLRTASEPVTLIAAWFAFTTTELWQLATIKKRKVDKNEYSNTETN